ncbi:hypothetical protein XAC908_1210004 [Xanthomonas citri pv. citri]|nr:hypothetical protein XAC908_1210004 [Xanthomonas citri pv. citri]
MPEVATFFAKGILLSYRKWGQVLRYPHVFKAPASSAHALLRAVYVVAPEKPLSNLQCHVCGPHGA